MIELAGLRRILNDALRTVEDLDETDLDETEAVTDQTKSWLRTERARISQELLHLSDQLALGSALARNEYWVARGFDDQVGTQLQVRAVHKDDPADPG